MKIFVTDHDGIEHELKAIDGWQIMEIIRDEGLSIKAECGGSCACATCHVYVDESWVSRVPEKSEEEADMLDLAFDVQDNSRLSCQIDMTANLDGLRVTLAPD
jgi:ferredoxin, 2Fe-2S